MISKITATYQVFDSEGLKYLRTIGSNLHLQAPRSIAINRGKIYIVDWGYTFIQVQRTNYINGFELESIKNLIVYLIGEEISNELFFDSS